MTKPMTTLAEFKRRAVKGAVVERRFPGEPRRSEERLIVHSQTNAIALLPAHVLTAEHIASAEANPQKYASWLYWPPARLCRFREGELIILNKEWRPIIALRILKDARRA
ncbi:MAG: hypothetical protein NW215_00535 [Hyphomicrobiales bacterium]|nr:hypothetical protein [Hyphomicrobiales bacterium]